MAIASVPTIGPYRILEKLGEGGMGVVYRARHTGSDRIVALKTVKIPSPLWLEAIRREIHALTQIRHPGVVRIVEHGVDQGKPWYAMDLLEGAKLAQFSERIWSRFRRPLGPPVGPTEQVSETEGNSGASVELGAETVQAPLSRRQRIDGPIPAAAGELRTVLRIMRRVCATLAFLHGEGFVNCDLKPANILLLEGEPVIIDFGLTAHHPGRSGREALETQPGMSGTPPYMSPEQVRGELLDARSDLYAVGCILYELVTGMPPFAGAPASVRISHLHHDVTPPSELVTDVPHELERVILRLLDKDLTARFGYADEVATLLASLCDDVHRLPGFPPPRSYLYRPRLVGRDALMKELVALRERAADGSGVLALLAGESGVGKTRVAIEVTRAMLATRMHAVTSELSSLLSDSSGVGASPLQAIRPLLQAVADRCQAGGPETTERLLGERRSVLAQYEPLLAQVPATGSSTPPMPLAVDASRRRLFKYTAETLTAFAQEQPVLWIIDDLGWADELSLSFLQSLTAEYLATTPAFILCTYRSEEASDAVNAIAQLPHVKHIALSRLEQDSVAKMVSDMLAMGDPKSSFVEFLGRQAEGNPFFVTEYLRGAVSERVLYRDSQHEWQMQESREDAVRDYGTLPLPGSLRELIEQRLRRLSPGGQQASLAAAVLGREADIGILREVAGLSDGAAVGAIDELVRRQVLESTEHGSVRFAHDKLREVAYGQAPAERLVQLHARAGKAIESRWRDAPTASQHWRTLGHHFAAAKLSEPAAKYLKLAADHARATFANGDAIQLYREAIKQASQLLLALSSESRGSQTKLVRLYEDLADLLALAGQRDEARTAYDEALSRRAEDVVLHARLLRKVAKTWEMQHEHETALRLYGDARMALGEDVPREAEEWIQVRLDELWVYYWLGRVEEMNALGERLGPLIEQRGTPAQRVRFFESQTQRNLRRDRYVVTDQTLGFARAALQACDNGAAPEARPMAQFGYGFALLFSNSFNEAVTELDKGLLLAKRVGDAALQTRALTYLSLASRMLGRTADTQAYTDLSATIATSTGMRDYVAAASANYAWLSLRRRELDAVITHAEQALEVWSRLTYVFPFQWTALVPLLGARLARNEMDRAASCAQALISETQHALPPRIANTLATAATEWRTGDTYHTRQHLAAALDHLRDTAYR